ncbi:hypothetical protein D9M68_838570 [compost metagenome]|uniref:hypothetical protein n=1 Tax=Hydrogenophaga sp. TaxID=1904254 RepID=UPI0028B2F839
MTALIRKATDADRQELVQTMCDADRQELTHLGITPAEALETIDGSETFTVELNQQVVAMFGIVQMKEGYGRIWMLSTDRTNRCKSLARTARQFVNEQARKHKFLTNVVWSKNAAHLNWIDWLGFHFMGVETYNGQRFVRFGLMGAQT